MGHRKVPLMSWKRKGLGCFFLSKNISKFLNCFIRVLRGPSRRYGGVVYVVFVSLFHESYIIHIHTGHTLVEYGCWDRVLVINIWHATLTICWQLDLALYYATVFIHVRYLSCIVYELTPKCHCGTTYWWVLIAKITMMWEGHYYLWVRYFRQDLLRFLTSCIELWNMNHVVKWNHQLFSSQPPTELTGMNHQLL